MDLKEKEEVKKIAVEFGDWLLNLSPSQKVSVWSKDGQYSGIFNMDTEQLFDKFMHACKMK